jgi:hypothetical protein
MWYAMWNAEKDDDSAFERRLDAVVREIGDRGKLMVPEAVTPFREPAPAPVPAPATAPKPAPAPAPDMVPASSTDVRSTEPAAPAPAPSPFATSAPMVEQRPLVVPQPTSSVGFPVASVGASLMEVSSFMAERLDTQLDKMAERYEAKLRDSNAKLDAQRQEYETKLDVQRQEMEARIEAQRQEMEARIEAQRQEMEARIEAQRQEVHSLRDEAKPQHASNIIDDESLDALQSRLQALLTAQLLSEEEVGVVEDTLADCIDLLPTAMCTDSTVDKVAKIVNLSVKMKNDTSFARQLKRRILK